jgi:hypothetical protein
MIVIALTASISEEWVGALVYGIFVLSVLAMLVGVALITVEIRTSQRSLAFEVHRVGRLPARVTEAWSTETVQA